MNRLLPVTALVLSLAALAVSLLRQEPPALPTPVAEVAEGPTRAQLEAWTRRVEALEVTTLSLARRAAVLERGAGLPEGSAGGVPASAPEAAALAAQVEQLKQEVRGLIVGEAMTSPAGREHLKEAVKAAQTEVAQERFVARQQQALQARQERLQRFIREARLSGSQERELTQLLDTEVQRTQALREQGLRGRARREALSALRSETDTAAARVLDEGQRTAYQQLRQEERPRGSGGRSNDAAAAPLP